MDLKNGIEKVLSEYKTINNPFEYVSSILDEDTTKTEKNLLIRIIVCLQRNNILEFYSHLRQCLAFIKDGIQAPKYIIDLCKHASNEYGFIIGEAQNTLEINAYALADVLDLKYDYSFINRRKKNGTIADSGLYNLFGYTNYLSLQQKLAIFQMKQLLPGDTYLACLPTGSGKSLIWQYGVARGQFRGATIVVVPTVALAIDHQNSDKEVFKRLPWIKSVAYSSQRSNEDEELLASICQDIENRKNYILYISPEGLTNYSICEALVKSAKNKNLSAIVIDEAHLIIDWGMKFRPEFQYIPALLGQLQKYANNKIYTVLLSATITEPDKETLKTLFNGNRYVEFRGDELRHEPEFYIHKCLNEKERISLLKRIILTAPKPAIVYVGTLEQCSSYYKEIKDLGFTRCSMFTGDLTGDQRSYLLNRWRNNEIDIMVATSAFGMGVDKGDVRTIITAYTPENISRYYQEVGRSGRDGYSSLNFVIYCPQVDAKAVGSFTDSKLIGTDNLIKRWTALRNNTTTYEESIESDCLWIDTDVVPEHLKGTETGSKNQNWNESVILLLARANLIEILSVIRTYGSHKAFRIKIKIKNFEILDDEIKLENYIDEFRTNERSVIDYEKLNMQLLLNSSKETCVSNFFAETFPYTGVFCAGCPACRKAEVSNTYGTPQIYSNSLKKGINYFKFNSDLNMNNDGFQVGTIIYDGTLDDMFRTQVVKKLFMHGIDIIICEGHIIIDELSQLTNDNYLIINSSELKRIMKLLKEYNIAFIIEPDSNDAQSSLVQARSLINNNNITLVVPNGLYDEQEGRAVSEYSEYVIQANYFVMEEIL